MRREIIVVAIAMAIAALSAFAGYEYRGKGREITDAVIDHVTTTGDEYRIHVTEDLSPGETEVCFEHGDYPNGEKCFPVDSGYTTDHGDQTGEKDFVSDSCERTQGNDNAFDDGTERFLISTGPDHEAVCRHQGLVTDEDCKPSAKWTQPMVRIDYHKQHQICVTGMPGTYGPIDKRCFDRNGKFDKDLGDDDLDCDSDVRTYSGDVTRCFDLYDIGER